ncbi:phosphonate ABC transporter substrate-binding protein [Paenibacillus darwinianus]|uniref:Phosphonate ABC transporter substrate-binding protein n=1 Tax=Paenibacillus darwinianus TaxID=1380763 RepID=A0A9W5S2H7_9BACL|nr:phosphate/phosphite/phosphonate ABC transporter substrate-binding protein [Paenibacillus darwinianus]EXX87749.1 phosphonate ABC transporter substrate-binding protein [Paenibacillus darwinianus]EXX91436.1 phosphonate ABC transporter substrate-binding protein [Paenibacillus darwinianus]EXX92238.1 phosphonate ABC transporter substrate-binding protein [Paenibacillus darwinianus]
MFRKRQSFSVLTCLLILGLLVTACGNANKPEPGTAANRTGDNAQRQEEILIGVIPAQGSNEMKLGADKLAAILAEKLGRKARAEVYPDYNGVVEAMGAGKVQMAYLGPLTYVEAHERYGVQAVVTQLIEGKPYYYSYLIAPADSPYASIEDVVAQSGDIRFAFGDINSTSGSLIPGIALKKADVFKSQQEHKFKSVTYTGDHTATALAVQNGQQDVGAIDSAYYNSLVKQGKVDGRKIKTIWQSEALFQYPWAVVDTFSDEEIATIREAMKGITDPDILSAFGGASGFTEASDEDYAAIRQAAIEDGRLKPGQ